MFLEQPREQPSVKLLDFGLAKLTDGEVGQISRTQTGTIVGTPLYISPEQATGKGVDHRTDIYALGCIAYEVVVGRVPFNSANVAELLSAHLVTATARTEHAVAGDSARAGTLLHSMLAKNPAERPTLQQIREVIRPLIGAPLPIAVGTPIPLSVPVIEAPPPIPNARNARNACRLGG